jgi:ATPase subunit of ABC transporter with duplicated ATPase domains
MLETLKRIEKPDEIVKPQFAFKFMRGASKQIMTLDYVEVGYNGSPVLPPVSLEVRRGEKIVFKGFNGIGKTTLLKSIYGDLPVISGNIEFGENIETVFLKQEEDYEFNFSSFDKRDRKAMGMFINGNFIMTKGRQKEITVIEFAKEYYPEVPTGELQKSMRLCGLTERHFFEQVRKLSGGEMTKLRMCLAMLNPVNLIILDEPTNHLDIYSKEVLTHALAEFEGTIISVNIDQRREAGLDEETIIVQVEDWPEHLTVGSPVSVSMSLESAYDVVVVPINAVSTTGSYSFVRIVEDGVSRERPVELGITTRTEVEIVSGLEEGELIAVR